MLHCGQGDTILMRLPDNRWVMVDCYLPRQSGIRARFFAFVQEMRINHLAMIVQTHPDFDHFHGMSEILEYFSTQGRKVDSYFDSGVGPKVVKALLKGDYRADEYTALQTQVESLARAGKLKKWHHLDAERPPLLSPEQCPGVGLVPIGPNATKRQLLIHNALRQLADNPEAIVDANGLSIVLGTVIQCRDQLCHVLLAADAEVANLEEALNVWNDLAGERGWLKVFDIVKVAHHGSIKNHYPRLCKMKRNESSVRIAAISAGERRVLPDKQVLEDYLADDWQVLLTTTRKNSNRKPDRPMQLANRSPSGSVQFAAHDIHIRWSAGVGLVFEPPEAKLKATDVSNFATAAR